MQDKSKILKEIRSWFTVFLSAFIILSCLNSKVFATAGVRQSSMEETLFSGQKLIIDKLTYNFSKPQQGDIIIFLENEEKGNIIDESIRFWNSFVLSIGNRDGATDKYPRMVKRVIGVEGDIVEIKDGFVYVNDELLVEDYVKGITYEGEEELPITVGEKQLFVLGDNREVSIDSREYGTIPIDHVEGKVVFRFYPFDTLGKIK